MTIYFLMLIGLLGTFGIQPSFAYHANPTIFEKSQEVAARVKGRVLGSFIRKGMTIEQVERILGKRTLVIPGFTSSSFSVGWLLDYQDLGVSIDLIHNRNDEGWLLVERVTFLPIFDVQTKKRISQEQLEREIMEKIREIMEKIK